MLNNAEIYKNRDAHTSSVVAELAELKYFDEQYRYYACAYAQDGRVKYRLHDNPDALYRFWSECADYGITPTGILSYTKFIKVPSGKEYEKAQIVQKEFVQKLQDAFPLTLFDVLGKLSTVSAVNRAADLLQAWRDELEYCYEGDQITLFEGVLKQARDARLIELQVYQAHKAWIIARNDIISNCENVMWRDKHFFYGYMYWENGKVKAYSNAERTIVEERHYNLVAQGIHCTPIFRKYYWFDSDKSRSIMKWRTIFEADMSALMDANYFQLLSSFWALPAAIDAATWQAWTEKVDGDAYPEAKKILAYYTNLFMI